MADELRHHQCRSDEAAGRGASMRHRCHRPPAARTEQPDQRTPNFPSLQPIIRILRHCNQANHIRQTQHTNNCTLGVFASPLAAGDGRPGSCLRLRVGCATWPGLTVSDTPTRCEMFPRRQSGGVGSRATRSRRSAPEGGVSRKPRQTSKSVEASLLTGVTIRPSVGITRQVLLGRACPQGALACRRVSAYWAPPLRHPRSRRSCGMPRDAPSILLVPDVTGAHLHATRHPNPSRRVINVSRLHK